MLIRKYSYTENNPGPSSTGIGFILVRADLPMEKIEKLVDGKDFKFVEEFEYNTEQTEYYDAIRHQGERFLPDAPVIGDIELTTVKYPKEKKRK